MNEQMRKAFLGKLVLILCQATPDELAAVYRFATREPVPETGPQGPISRPKRGPADGSWQVDTQKPTYVFQWTGMGWEVIYRGGRAFHLPNTLGVRCVSYLLHAPNEPIEAFALEVAVQPERGLARSRDSIQLESDSRAKRQYREALRQLQAQREAAEAAGDRQELEHLESQIVALESELKAGGAADTGERARNNVRRAIRRVIARLEKGCPEGRAFAEHLRAHLSLGYECLYLQPQGRIWA